MRRVGNIITRYPNITYQSFLFSTRGGERDIREFHRDEKIKRWESIIFHRATAMAALNPVYAEIHRRYDRFFALFFTDSLLFISLPPFPSHSFCHRFIFPSPAPSTAVYHWRTVQSQPRPDSWLRERDGGYIGNETICLEMRAKTPSSIFLRYLYYSILSFHLSLH